MILGLTVAAMLEQLIHAECAPLRWAHIGARAEKTVKKIKPSRPGGGHGKPLNFHKSSGRWTNLKSEVSVAVSHRFRFPLDLERGQARQARHGTLENP
jgi:hypothetical protein